MYTGGFVELAQDTGPSCRSEKSTYVVCTQQQTQQIRPAVFQLLADEETGNPPRSFQVHVRSASV